MEQLFGGRGIDREEIGQRLNKAAQDFGVPFRGSDTLYNSRLAQELGLWSESKNRGDDFHAAVFRAYFVDGKNIASIPVLVELASSVSLPADEAAEVLATKSFKAAVDADWDLSRKLSITAVPTVVMNRDRLVGAQAYEALKELVEANGARKRG